MLTENAAHEDVQPDLINVIILLILSSLNYSDQILDVGDLRRGVETRSMETGCLFMKLCVGFGTVSCHVTQAGEW